MNRINEIRGEKAELCLRLQEAFGKRRLIVKKLRRMGAGATRERVNKKAAGGAMERKKRLAISKRKKISTAASRGLGGRQKKPGSKVSKERS